MTKIVAVLLVLTAAAFPCGLDKDKLDRSWRVPDDAKKIKTLEIKKYRFGMLDGAEGVLADKVTYKQPGLLMRAPDGRGWWAFRDALRLHLNGKVFAVYAVAYFPSIDDKGKIEAWMGCLTTVVVYDNDGNGTFETAQEVDSMKKGRLHIPSWVQAGVGEKSK